ncbi:MAG: sugar transferase [Terriglobia bacterium]|jgi:exopolysaccharide biosynthesis polyprenyl glycosylphosphotransferase
MFARHNRLIGLLYLFTDFLLVLASFGLAHALRAHLPGARQFFPISNYPWIIPLIVALWVGAGVMAGIYREVHEEVLRRAFADPLKVGLAATVLLFAVISVVKFEYISRLLLGIYALIDLFLMVCFRLVARAFAAPLRRSVSGLRTFLLVGGGPEMADIAHTLEANESRGMRLFGFVHTGAEPAGASGQGLAKSYPAYTLPDLPDLLRRQVIDEVIFVVAKEDLEKLGDTFLVCEEEGVKTRVLLSFFPQVISKVYLERLGSKPLLTFSAMPEDEFLLLKRAIDFVMALIALVALSPLLLILAALVKLTSRGPIFFSQTRCGLGGRKFTLYKFRSMRADADLVREELAALNEVDGPVFKIRNDPRCTPIGRFMRKFSLDELPQLVNIIRGDMSFVGPRPPLPEEVEKYERWQRRRLRMQPGLTCLWALEGRNKLSFRRWMELDLEYIDHWSMTLDWKILVKTIPIVLVGRGAS